VSSLMPSACRTNASSRFSENKIRRSEIQVCNILKKHPDIRFEMKKVETTADKVFLLLQVGSTLHLNVFYLHPLSGNTLWYWTECGRVQGP